MAVGALRAAGLAAAALGYHVWRLLTKPESDEDREDTGEGLRSHPLGPEVELSSFSGNSSQAVDSSPRSAEPSPRLTPLPEQLEPADSAASQQALDQWDSASVKNRRAGQVREYELSVMDHPEGTHHLPNNVSAAALLNNPDVLSDSAQNHARTSSAEQPDLFHTPEGSPGSSHSELGSALSHKLPSQEAALDEFFPSIRKITPAGSPEDETLHAGPLCADPLQPNQPKTSQVSSSIEPPADLQADQQSAEAASSQAAPDLHPHSAARLARLNTVSRTASPDRSQPAATALQNGHIPDDQADRKAGLHSASTSASSALSQLLHSDTQPSTGTPMARDLTEALTALASNKRLLSSMQASRSFSSPDLLSLAQQLHDSGQWDAVQDMVQQEEEDQQSFEQGQASAKSRPDNYGTVVGRSHMGAAEDAELVSSPASPTLLDSHRSGRSSLDSLKRAREVLEMPLALRLDVLAGPAQNKSYTTDPGVTQVTVGRLEDNTLPVPDTEVSGRHVVIRWDPNERCWQVTDTGSLNGTFLNGKTISTNNRKQGREHRLSSDDMMQLGSYSKVRVSYFPMEMLDQDMPVHPKKVHTPPSSHHSSPNEEKTESAAPLASSPDIGSRFHSDTLRLEGCAFSETGREHQRRGHGCEDVIHWEVPLRSASNGTSVFCIFDGHCGRNSAREARDLLPQILSEGLHQVNDSLQKGNGADSIWENTFLSTDSHIKSEEGCTATALLVWKDSEDNVCLQAANVGDSAVIFSSDTAHKDGLQMTADHRLTNPDERQRLADMGIHLGQDRTRLYGLNLSRCLGDKFLKDEDLGLSAHPHISKVVKVSPDQSGVVVMASDGLWDVTDSHRVLQIVRRVSKESNGSVHAMTDAVVQHAQRQRTRDDLSVVLLKVKALNSSSSFA